MKKPLFPPRLQGRQAVNDLPVLSANAVQVLKSRYLLRDDRQRTIETPQQLFQRVARHVAGAEKNFRSGTSVQETEDVYFRMMRDLEFLPNSPTLMNAGTPLGQLSACFVLPVADSLSDIFEALKHMARIHQTGGGTGFDFSRLRPRGDLVSATKGTASGPVSFMRIFDQATDVVIQGGRRRGANMGILRCDHPDILEFIEAKKDQRSFANFNLSVAMTDAFMEAVRKKQAFDLVNPRTGKKSRSVKAAEIFDRIVQSAWETGDPGLMFIDEVNRYNPTPQLGLIEATNPCGELPLLPYESCNLASINLSRMVKRGRLDEEKLKVRVHWGVRFLDDVIEINKFPLPAIQSLTQANRKIGLGVMGFADLLIKLGIPYDSKEAVAFARRLMRFIRRESLKASAFLARERGRFPNFKGSASGKAGLVLRNATVNSIAPTGTISLIAGCSSGIEPLFGISFVRNVLSGARLFEVNPLFEAMAKEEGFLSKDLLDEIASRGSLRQVPGVPADIRRKFATTFDVSPKAHLTVQAAFQEFTDNAVSKTVNLPAEATATDIRSIYLSAHKSKCKGITVYRYGSKTGQVLTLNGPGNGPSRTASGPVSAGAAGPSRCAPEACSD